MHSELIRSNIVLTTTDQILDKALNIHVLLGPRLLVLLITIDITFDHLIYISIALMFICKL